MNLNPLFRSVLFRTALLLFTLFLLLSFAVACTEPETPGNSEHDTTETPTDSLSKGTPPERWNHATYTEDTLFGDGAKTFTLEVAADGYSVIFTVMTDERFLGAALLAHDLITGENGDYGLYITSVNGMSADYATDHAYWAISKGSDYLMTGIDKTPVEDGARYALTYTKD